MPPLPLAGSSWWGTLDFPKIKGCGDRKCGSLGSSLTALGRKPAHGVIPAPALLSAEYFWSAHSLILVLC